MAKQMADTATEVLRQKLPEDIPIDIHAYKEAFGFSVGSGSGLT